VPSDLKLTAEQIGELERLEARSRNESLAPIDRAATFGALQARYIKLGPALIAAAKATTSAEQRVAAEERVKRLTEALQAVLHRDDNPPGTCCCINHSRNAEREYETGTCPHQRARTDLAQPPESKETRG